MCFFSPFSRQKYYNKSITTRDNGDVQPHDQEESKLNSTINENKSAHTPTHDKIVKHAFNKNNVASTKRKQNSNKDFIPRTCRIDTMVLM